MSGRTILITGAAGGLGSAIARQAAKLGAELVLLDNNQSRLNQLHDELEAEHNKQPGLYPLDLRGANTDDYTQLAGTIEDAVSYTHLTLPTICSV